MSKLTLSQMRARERVDFLVWQGVQARDRDSTRAALAATPSAWETIEMDAPVLEKRVKMTLYLTESVAKVFRNMGTGYQARIDLILRTWLQHQVFHRHTTRQSFIDTRRKAKGIGDKRNEQAIEDLMEYESYRQGYEDGKAAFRQEAVERGWVVIDDTRHRPERRAGVRGLG